MKPEMTPKDAAQLRRLMATYGYYRVLNTFAEVAYDAHRMSKTFPHSGIQEAAHALYDWEEKTGA